MGYLKKWTVGATVGATVGLAGIVGIGTGLAGAAQSGDALQHSTAAVQPNAVPFNPGTYEWFINGAASGTITIASNNTFTSTVDGGDSGTWVQAGETFGLWISGGTDASGGCVFAGHAVTDNMVSYAGKPGHWACPGFESTGTFYIAPVTDGVSASHVVRSAFASSGVQPMNAGKLLLGRYKWTEDGYYSGIMTIASNNTYTSTLTGSDSGSWVQSGSAAAFNITGGPDGGIGCLEVGKVNHTGTAVGTSTKPGNWACPGTGTSGYFVLKYKG
jgi:hypothetical protein